MEPSLSIPLKLYREGSVTFYSTDLEHLERMGLSYTKAPVFYNPRMKLNRDITISIVKSTNVESAADLMAASGVRALRLAVEGGVNEVMANDSNCLAVHVIKLNARLNGVRIRATCSDARLEAEKLAWEGNRPHYLDLDPFGSPAPYIDSFLRAVRRGGILGVTATDTPPLFGIYPDKLFRYYGVWGRKLPFHKEFGIRALISFTARIAARLDLVARPLLSYGKEHYIRVFFSVDRGPSASSRQLRESLGWVEICDGEHVIHRGIDPPGVECGELLGPLWLDEITDPQFLEGVAAINEEAERLLHALREESGGPPFYYMLDDICSRLRTKMPKISDVIATLRERGYFATRTHLEPLGVKTTASRSEMEEVVREITAS